MSSDVTNPSGTTKSIPDAVVKAGEDLVTAAIQAVPALKTGTSTSEWRAYLIEQGGLFVLNCVVWAAAIWTTKLPSWAPPLVSSLSVMTSTWLTQALAQHRTNLKIAQQAAVATVARAASDSGN